MIKMPHQITINGTPKKVFDAITTTKGIKGWWSTDAKAGPLYILRKQISNKIT